MGHRHTPLPNARAFIYKRIEINYRHQAIYSLKGLNSAIFGDETSMTEKRGSVAEQAETCFRRYCDKARITYLYIEQAEDTKSSEIIRSMGQRPDYLIVEPYKPPFFLDVKARKFVTEVRKTGEKRPKKFYGRKDITAIFLHINEFDKLWAFQSLIGIPVWIAFFERITKTEVRPDLMYVVPLNVAKKFRREESPLQVRFFQIPIKCCSLFRLEEPKPMVYTQCQYCEEKFCENLDKIMKEYRLRDEKENESS